MPQLIYDEFIIKNKIQLNNDDIDSLTKLYLPLMGLDSYSLYLSLTSLDEKKPYNYKIILDTLNFKSVKAIDKASDKLEALGLIRLFVNKDNNYLYDLIRPLSIASFLKEEVLCSLLQSSIGESEILKLKDKYLKTYNGYKDISKKFDEVFEIKTTSDFSFIKKLKDLNKPNIEIENKDFNYALFKMLFDSSFIGEDVLDNADLKENITRLSYLYKLNEEKMKDVVLSSFSIDKELNYASLAKYAKMAYRNSENKEDPMISNIVEDDYISSIKDDAVLALCTRMEEMSPSEVLEYYNDGFKASASEIAMFDKISKDTGTPIPLINLMIVYSIVTKEGDIPGYAYFEKVAATWKRAKIKNVYDGIKYMQEKAVERENNQGKKLNGKKEVKLPSWYKDYKEELNKKAAENENLQEGNALDILEAAKGFFGDEDE